MHPVLSLAAGLGIAALLTACTTAPVRVWERGPLARADMAWEPDPLHSTLRDHIHVSREAASGGASTGGGGCGCN